MPLAEYQRLLGTWLRTFTAMPFGVARRCE
jgi:hypothetical protein